MALGNNETRDMIKNINEIKRDFIRLRSNEMGLLLEVCQIDWDGPHTPSHQWVCVKQFGETPQPCEHGYPLIRDVVMEGSEGKVTPWVEVDKAVERVLKNRHFFRVCGGCRLLHPVGHMHDDFTCQSCAEKNLGLVY
ncbi:hypothetical protein [Aeromonas veronii]|uniref:hypothetical protein n=1 Tax=Aeromonas veronii TaxID=654 RepID=UPI0028DA9EB5|nr:hypothetical protein [Aeromonas veronii]